jgi:hypothetical protein
MHLLTEVDHALVTARRLKLTNAEYDLSAYKSCLESKDDLTRHLVRHFAAELCLWVRARDRSGPTHRPTPPKGPITSQRAQRGS